MSPALRIKLFFALAALCLASAVRAQDGAYAVSGRVIDRLTRQPVAYAAVVPVGQEQRGASTDSLGRFRLERVQAGIFRLSASSVGYKTVVTPEYLVSAATPFIEIEMEEDANLLIFPTLDAANIAYNLVKTAAGNGIAVGPILLGCAKPVHILTPSATVRRIVNMTALTVADANAAR